MPLVSVVIPTYNHAKYLGRALRTVLDQTYDNWEVIVVDNHSTDHTEEVLSSFSDPRIKKLKIYNGGIIAVSRNAGILAAKGEWVAFLDSDDWWSCNKLQVCSDYFLNGIDFIYHNMEFVGDTVRFFHRRLVKSWQVRTPVLVDLLLRGNAIVNSSVVVRKAILERVGGMSQNIELIAVEDYNTWLRIAEITDHFVHIPSTLGYYLKHDKNISHKDMSVSTRYAVSEFCHLLNEKQLLALEVNLRYARGRFNYMGGDYLEAKRDFGYCMINNFRGTGAKSAVFFAMSTIKRGITF